MTDVSTMSTTGVPGRTSSPSATSTKLPFRYIRLTTTRPPKGAGHLHQLGVPFGVAERPLGALPANLENANFGRRRLPLEGERLLQLLEPRHGLVQGERVLLGVDLRNELVLAHIEPGPLDVVLGRR